MNKDEEIRTLERQRDKARQELIAERLVVQGALASETRAMNHANEFMVECDKLRAELAEAKKERDKAFDEVFKKTGGPFTEVQVPEGKKLYKRVGYQIPDDFQGIQLVKVHGRKWWQFWLPKTLYLYTVIR